MLALDVSNEPIESCLPPILAQIWDTRLSCVIAEKNNHQSEEKALFFGSYLHLGRVRTACIAHSRIIYSSLRYTLSCIVLSPSLSQLETLLLQNNSLSLLGMKRQCEMFMCSLTYLSSDSSSHVVPPRRQFEALRFPRHQRQEADCGHHQQCRGRRHPSLQHVKLRHWRCRSLSAPSPRPRSPS